MDYATHYDVGDRKRGTGINEDSVAVSVFEQGHRDGVGDRGETGTTGESATGGQNRSAAVFALADGAGGYEAGDVASYLATTVVCEELADVAVRAARSDPVAFDVPVDEHVPDAPDSADLRAAVEDAVVAAHREVVRYAAESDTQAYTTVVAGVVVDGACHYGWVGDSRAYLLNDASERIELITRDHNVVEELRERGEIDAVESHVHPRGNEITDALGGAGGADPETATVAVETNSVPLYADDVLLVTSDGLVDAQTDAPTLYDQYVAAGRDAEAAATVREAVVTDADIREVVLGADSLETAGTGLLAMANDRGGKDNLSAVLLRDPALPETPAGGPPDRAFDPIEDRETVIVPDE